MTGQLQGAAAAPMPFAGGGLGRIGVSDSDSATHQFISFAVGNDHYGVGILSVREIKVWSEIAFIPRQPEYIRGVLNLRGVVVPILDLRCWFGQGLTEATPQHIVIVVQVGQQQIGLLVDQVLDIVAFEASQIQPVPRVAQSSRLDFLSGLVTAPSGMIALIDLDNLISGGRNGRDETAG